MNIFYRRPLCLILCIALGAFVFFSVFEDQTVRIIFIALTIAALILTFIKSIKQIIPIALTRIICIVILSASVFSFIFFDLWFKAYDRYDNESQVVGQVEDVDCNSNSTTLYIRSKKINESSISNYKLIAYVSLSEAYGCEVGDEVVLKGEIKKFASGEDFDAESYYMSRGYSGVIYYPSEFSYTKGTDIPFSYKISEIRSKICDYTIKISDNETGGLLSALVMGERDYLPLGTKVDFSRIGISHVLALSGMHLAILVIGLSKLLSAIGVGKKISTVISIVFTVAYMTLTGFSVSVTRAGVMLICSSLLYLLSRTKDSMTSLAIAVTLIVIISPYSIYDTSLWLSAFATLGIVVFSEYQNGKVIINPFINWIVTSMLSTFFALGATFIFTSLRFDGISMLSPLSTFVFSILIEIFIYVGLIMLAVGWLIPVKYVFIPLGRFILDFSSLLSNLDFVYGATSDITFKTISVIFSILFYAFLLFRIKHKKICITVLALLLTTSFLLSAFITNNYEKDESITYSKNNGEHIIITDNGCIGFIDVANHSTSTTYDSNSSLIKKNLVEIDKYIFVNYSFDLNDSLEKLLNTVLIREIYLPTPRNYNEEKIFSKALTISDEANVKIIRYDIEDFIRIGEISVIPLYRYDLGSSKELLFTILNNDSFYTYCTANMLSEETKNIASEIIGGSHTVIFGCHENQNSDIKFNSKIPNVKTFIFASDTMSFSQSAVEYYSNKNCYFNPRWFEIIR